MSSLNKILIIGNLGDHPELRYTSAGNPVASFSVAVNRVYAGSNGEQKEETEWFNVIVWNKQAVSCHQYITKGSQVYVEGRLRTRCWEDQVSRKHYRTEVIASQVIFLSKKEKPGFESDDIDDIFDDIPF